MFLTIAWALQLLTGYGIRICIARSLGVEAYGTYGVVMAVLLWIEVGVLSGFPTAIQRFAAAHPEKIRAIIRYAGGFQFVYILILFAGSFLAAPWVARILKDTSLEFLLRLALVDIWFYGYYFIFLSLQNGLHHFGRQAALIALYSVSKLICVLVLVDVTRSVSGALIANILGSVTGLSAAFVFGYLDLKQRPKESLEPRHLLQFAVPVIIYSLVIHLIYNLDLWMVKYFHGSMAAGYYSAAGAVSQIPYYLFFGLSSTVLPYLSGLLARGDMIEGRQLIGTACRILTIVALPMAVFVTVYGKEIIMLIFGDAFSPAGHVLQILFWGMVLLAFLFLMTTFINADNKPKLSLFFTFGTLIFCFLFNTLLIPRYGTTGAAVATTAALLLGNLAGGTYILMHFRIRFGWMSMVRIGLASAVVFVMASVIRVEGWHLVWSGSIMMIVYAALLIGMKELNLKNAIHGVLNK